MFANTALCTTGFRCPGIGPKGAGLLQEYGVLNDVMLAGQYLAADREDAEFVAFLRDIGIRTSDASRCVLALSSKLGAL